MHVVALVVPVCCSLPRCVMCLKVLSWCCVTLWWATWITPWCTTWSGDSLSSNCTSYTTCWRYSLTTPAHVPRLASAAQPSHPLCCQVADRLFSSFGQDILDALYWTATEPKEKKRAHIGVIPHFLMAVLYVCILTEKLLDRLIVCLISSYSYNELLRRILMLSSVLSVFVSLVCVWCSSPCHPHYGSGHHSQCSLQLPQQVPAHHHDVKQRESNLTQTRARPTLIVFAWILFTWCDFAFCSLWRLKEACSRSLKRTTCSRCPTVVSDHKRSCV